MLSHIGYGLEDKEKFLAALRRAIETSEDPRGPMKLDEWSNPTQNIYILKVERVGMSCGTRFWAHPPQEFLKLPLCSRDYPAARP